MERVYTRSVISQTYAEKLYVSECNLGFILNCKNKSFVLDKIQAWSMFKNLETSCYRFQSEYWSGDDKYRGLSL